MKSMLVRGEGLRLVCPDCGEEVRVFDARDLGMLLSEAIMHRADCRG